MNRLGLARHGPLGLLEIFCFDEGRLDIHDGAPWILEGRRGSAYHLVYRTSPSDGEFKAASQILLELGGVADDSK